MFGYLRMMLFLENTTCLVTIDIATVFKLQISRKIWHAAIVLLLGCDIATNPGPNVRPAGPHKPRANSILNDIAINTRSLKSLHSINGKQTRNLTRFQELVFTEDADLTLVTETWLNRNTR